MHFKLSYLQTHWSVNSGCLTVNRDTPGYNTNGNMSLCAFSSDKEVSFTYINDYWIECCWCLHVIRESIRYVFVFVRVQMSYKYLTINGHRLISRLEQATVLLPCGKISPRLVVSLR